MYLLIGLVAAIVFVAVIIFAINFSKNKNQKKVIKTVRSLSNDGTEEPESRYRSVTATLGKDDEQK